MIGLILFSFQTMASSSAELPVKMLGFQAFNFFVFIFVFLFLLKKPIKTFFKERRENFLQEEKDARSKEEFFKKEYQSWFEKVQNISFEEENLSKKVEKEKLRYESQKEMDIKNFSERLKREQEFIIHLEQQKLKKQVLQNIKMETIQQAQKELVSEGVQPEFQVRFYKEFSNQLEKSL